MSPDVSQGEGVAGEPGDAAPIESDASRVEAVAVTTVASTGEVEQVVDVEQDQSLADDDDDDDDEYDGDGGDAIDPDRGEADQARIATQGALPLDVRTGDPGVDAAVGLLRGLDDRPVADHAEVFTSVHRALQDALVDLDRS